MRDREMNCDFKFSLNKKASKGECFFLGKSHLTRDLRLNRVRNLGLPHRKEYVQRSRALPREHGASLSRNLRACIDFLQQETAAFPHVKVNFVWYCLSGWEYWHGTFFNIRRFRLLFVTTVRISVLFGWEQAGKEGSLWELPTINNMVYFQVLSLNATLTYSLKEPHYLTDTSTGEIHNNVFRSLKKAFPLRFLVLHLLPQTQVFW